MSAVHGHAADLQRPIAAGVPLLQWTYGLVNRIVMGADVVLICLSGVLPFLLRFPLPPALTIPQAVLIAALEATVFTLALRSMAAYRVENYARFWPPLVAVAAGLCLSWAVGCTFLLAFQPLDLSAIGTLAAFHAPQIVVLVLARQGARLLWRAVRTRHLVRRNVVLIGAGAIAGAILAHLLSPSGRVDYRVLGVFFDDTDERRDGMLDGQPILGGIDGLGVFAQTNVIDLVIVAQPLPRAARTVSLIEHLQWMAADVVIPVDGIGLRPATRGWPTSPAPPPCRCCTAR